MSIRTHCPYADKIPRLAPLAYAIALAASTAPAFAGIKVIHVGKVRAVHTRKAAGKTHVPLKATFSEHAISAKTIREAAPSRNIETILARTPSVNAYSAGPNGVRSTITFRSFNSGQFSETFDGIPLNDMFNGGVTNQASERNAIPLTLNDISGIQIFNGINKPSVNAYNSLGGTINYLPREPGHRAGASVSVGYGSFATGTLGITANTGSIDGTRSLFAYRRTISDGWVNNATDQNSNYYYAGVHPYDAGRGRLSAYLVVNHNAGYTPHSVPLPLIARYGRRYNWGLDESSSTNNDTEITAILGNSDFLNRDSLLNTKFSVENGRYHRISYSNPAAYQSATQPYPLPNQGTGFDFWSSYPVPPTYDPTAVFGSVQAGTSYHLYEEILQSVGFTPKLTMFLPHNTVTVGGNVTYGLLHSAEFWYGSAAMPTTSGYNDAWDEHDARVLSSAYIQDKITLLDGALHITPGVKYLQAYTSSSDNIGIYYPIGGTVTNNTGFVSPTLGISYAPSGALSVFAAWGRNVKFPNIGAYYSNIAEQNSAGQYVVVPVTTQPEYATDCELGMRYRHAGLKGGIDAYRELFRNTFINTTNITGLSTTSNGGSSRYQGVEIAGAEDLGRLDIGRFTAYANYSYNQAVFTSSFNSAYAGTVSAGQPLANVPRNMINAGLSWRWRHIHAWLDGKFVGTQYVNQQFAGVPGAARIPAYFVANIGVTDSIPVHAADVKTVKLALHVDNIFNRHYITKAYSNTDYYNNPYLSVFEGMPFSIYGSVTAKF